MNPSSLFGLCDHLEKLNQNGDPLETLATTDADKYHYFKIDDKLYLFVWREKVIPTLIAVMISLNRNKTTSKIFVFKGTDFKNVNNFAVGAKTSVLNTTTHAPT